MNDKLLSVGLVALAVILGAVYAIRQQGSPGTTIPESTFTETTTTEPAIIPIDPNIIPECLSLNTNCKKDRCYFGNALNKNNSEFCGQIKSQRLAEECIEKITYSKPVEKVVVEGQVFNTKDCGIYQDLPVEMRDESGNITLAATTTNAIGEYGFSAETNGNFGIYLKIDGRWLSQDIRNMGNRVYIVDFALS